MMIRPTLPDTPNYTTLRGTISCSCTVDVVTVPTGAELELAVSLYVDPDPALTFAAIAAADTF